MSSSTSVDEILREHVYSAVCSVEYFHYRNYGKWHAYEKKTIVMQHREHVYSAVCSVEYFRYRNYGKWHAYEKKTIVMQHREHVYSAVCSVEYFRYRNATAWTRLHSTALCVLSSTFAIIMQQRGLVNCYSAIAASLRWVKSLTRCACIRQKGSGRQT